MSASKETLDAGSTLIEEESQEVDESKLSWLERRRLKKQRAAAQKSGVIHDLVMDDIEIGEDFEELDTYPVRPPSGARGFRRRDAQPYAGSHKTDRP